MLIDIVWHLRGWASNRSVPRTKHCLQHNMGLGGATVVTILGRADNQVAPCLSDIEDYIDGRKRMGYNPALEVRGVRQQDFNAVKSRKASSKWAAETFEALRSSREASL